MPAVVAVNSYVPGSYFGRNVLTSGSVRGRYFKDGYIVTNQHVIDDAAQIMVVTPIHAASKLLWSERIV